ncbi:MAG: exodeoxyribonuclease III [Myxococcales bacterium]|nr:exodeoxyribonuclease III [Myxococcales bacterium]
MNITTWNVNSVRRRLERVLEWVDEHEPDVLCLQELKCQDAEFPAEAFTSRGYSCSVFGQKAYNGVAILSHRARVPHSDVVTDFPVPGDGQARGIACTVHPERCAPLRLVNLYVVNGGELDSDKYSYKLKWLDALVEWVQAERQRWAGPMIVCGDFNIAQADLDVHDPKRWAGQVLCTDAERERLDRLKALGFQDSWRALHPAERTFSWFDYRGAGFDRNEGLRIDLHLVSGLPPQGPIDVVIDHDARGRPESSDHAPVTIFLGP